MYEPLPLQAVLQDGPLANSNRDSRADQDVSSKLVGERESA